MSAFRSSGAEPMFNLPPMTGALILANLVVELVMQLLPEAAEAELVFRFGFIPELYHHGFAPELLLPPLTYQFLHGGWVHVGINALSLAAFGSGVERWLGSLRMLVFYLICGVLAAGVQFLFTADPTMPVIGASGAISGLFGGVLIIIRRQRGSGLLVMSVIWVAMTVVFGFVSFPGTGDAPIAWQAHIGGFLAGLLLFKAFEPRWTA